MIKNGFFNVEDLHIICNAKTFQQAKIITKQCIDEYVSSHPKTNPKNIAKILNVLNSCRTVNQLGIAVSNFILAHPSENLSMSRGE